MNTDSARTRPGGRSAKVRKRVFDVVRQALTEQDWESLTIGEIAERSGVNKTTIYRRWLNKERLVADLLGSINDAHPHAPDTGSIVEDLALIGEYLANVVETPFGRSIVASVAGSSDSALEEAARNYWGQLFEKVGRIVQRSIDRREMKSDTDPQQIVELVLAPIYLRALVTKKDLSIDSIRDVAKRVIEPHLS